MFDHVTNLILATRRGEPRRPHRPVPPDHLCEQTWKYLCDCGYGWKKEADAVWRDEGWRSPMVECVNCHAWQDGRQITGTERE